MKILCLVITFLGLLLAVVFGFAGINQKDAAKKYLADAENLAEIQKGYEAEIGELEQKIAELSPEKETLTVKKEYLEEMARYRTEKTAFLTFDDGPSTNTLKILDILKQYDIKATFLVVASKLDNLASLQALQRMADEGNTIAIHAYNHVYSDLYQSKDAFFADFDKASALIEEKTGKKPEIARLPGGTYSAWQFCQQYGGDGAIFDEIMDEFEKRNIMVADWNVDSEDWNSATTAAAATENIVSGARKRLSGEYKTALILMHDFSNTIASLENTIGRLKGMGFSFETLHNGGYYYRQK